MRAPTASASAEPIIRVEGLTAGYGDFILLENVSFEVRRGEVFVILGGSGCGKSTLMKHMIGLYPPKAGRVLIDGDDIVTADDATLHKILRKIGVMYQSGALFGSMTLLENVRLPLEEYTDLTSAEIASCHIDCRLTIRVHDKCVVFLIRAHPSPWNKLFAQGGHRLGPSRYTYPDRRVVWRKATPRKMPTLCRV